VPAQYRVPRFLCRSDAARVDALEPAEEALGKFDLIVCNPPYIFGGRDGRLDVSRALSPGTRSTADRTGFPSTGRSSQLSRRPCPRGGIVFECGEYQAQDVSEILSRAGYREIKIGQDLNKIDRVVRARI
jgi:methylase of polypeptide subunit release factors